MRIRRVCLGLLLVFASINGWAQELQRDTIYSDFSRTFLEELGDTTDVITTEISRKSNWFVSVAGGPNSLHAEANRLYDHFYERMHPSFQISVGKWINPWFGLRLQIGTGGLSGHYYPFFFYNLFYQLQDHTIIPTEAVKYLTEDGQWFHRKFNYLEGNISFMTDVVRWFRKKESRWGVYLMAGPGIAHAFENQGILAGNSFAFKGALQVNYRIHDYWDIFAEYHGTIVDESFDGQIGGYDGAKNRTLEGWSGLSLGVSYRFGGRKFQKYVRVNPVAHETVLRTFTHVNEIRPKGNMTPFFVRFYIDQHNIEPNQQLNIERVAQYMKQHPETTVLLSGYADKETAYPAYNLKLSERRCNSVKKYLIGNCGIDASRIRINPQGDITKVFDHDHRWNRLVVLEIITNP